MTPPPAVTFDFHDTLASCDRWFDLEVRTLPAEVLARLPGDRDAGRPGHDAAVSAYRALRTEIVGHGLELDATACVLETFRRLGVSAEATVVAGTIHDLMRAALSDVAPMPGAVETVRALHAAGVTLGVVSSAVHHPFLEWVLDGFGILGCFGTVVTSASAGFYKSRPEIYLHALRELGASPGASCHVGDSYRWDHLTPKTVGMRTALVSPTTPEVGPDDPEPDLRLTSLVGAGGRIAGLVGAGAARTGG